MHIPLTDWRPEGTLGRTYTEFIRRRYEYLDFAVLGDAHVVQLWRMDWWEPTIHAWWVIQVIPHEEYLHTENGTSREDSYAAAASWLTKHRQTGPLDSSVINTTDSAGQLPAGNPGPVRHEGPMR